MPGIIYPKNSNPNIYHGLYRFKIKKSSNREEYYKRHHLVGDISTFFVDESNPLVQDELEKNSINIPKVISIDDSSDIEMATTINRENLVDDRLAILNENTLKGTNY